MFLQLCGTQITSYIAKRFVSTSIVFQTMKRTRMKNQMMEQTKKWVFQSIQRRIPYQIHPQLVTMLLTFFLMSNDFFSQTSPKLIPAQEQQEETNASGSGSDIENIEETFTWCKITRIFHIKIQTFAEMQNPCSQFHNMLRKFIISVKYSMMIFQSSLSSKLTYMPPKICLGSAIKRPVNLKLGEYD